MIHHPLAHDPGLFPRPGGSSTAPPGPGCAQPAPQGGQGTLGRPGGALRVGIVGLATVGAPLASRLVRAGHLLFLYAHRRFPDHLVGVRATLCTRPRGVAERADIVFVALRGAPELAACLDGPTGVAAGWSKGKAVVCVDAGEGSGTEAMAGALRGTGCDCLQLSVPAGEAGLADLVSRAAAGGTHPLWSRLQPLFDRTAADAALHA
jgi:2-hydroxy-3-oxopropionate reductase